MAQAGVLCADLEGQPGWFSGNNSLSLETASSQIHHIERNRHSHTHSLPGVGQLRYPDFKPGTLWLWGTTPNHHTIIKLSMSRPFANTLIYDGWWDWGWSHFSVCVRVCSLQSYSGRRDELWNTEEGEAALVFKKSSPVMGYLGILRYSYSYKVSPVPREMRRSYRADCWLPLFSAYDFLLLFLYFHQNVHLFSLQRVVYWIVYSGDWLRKT